MVTEEHPVSLLNLAGGAAVEKFDMELARILENIMDPNTKQGKRSVVLTVGVTKHPEHDMCQIEIDCVGKPSPAKSFSVAAVIGRDESGNAELREMKSVGNGPLFGGKVTPMRKGK